MQTVPDQVQKQKPCQLRVVHVLCDRSAGGAERLVLELCRRAAPDIQPEVVTVQEGGSLEFPKMRCAGRPRKHLGLRALWRMRGWLRGADVVHTHLFAGDTWGRLAASSPVVTTLHNSDPEETWQPWVERRLQHRSQRVVAVSAAVAEHARRVERLRVDEVLWNGVDLGRFLPHVGGGGVLAVGRRVPQKGFDLLLRALPAGLPLEIVGEGPFFEAHPQVKWLGRQENIPERMARADILAVPSRWEGFGLVAVEGMAAGLPVVAFAVEGLAEVIGEAGVLVPPGDIRAFGEALRRLSENPGERKRLGELGRQRAQKFSLERMVRRYEEIYRELGRG